MKHFQRTKSLSPNIWVFSYFPSDNRQKMVDAHNKIILGSRPIIYD